MSSARRSMCRLTCTLLTLSFCFASIAAFAQEPQREEPQPPKIIRKSGGVFQGSATRRVEPAYPPLAKAARVSGSVVVEVTVDEEGNIISARALSGHPLLKDAAVGKARGWRFKPTLLQGEPVKVIGTITFNFNMGDPKEIENLKEQITTDPNSAELRYKLGLAYYFDGQNDRAIGAYNQALQLRPDYADAYSQLGATYSSIGQSDKAIEALKQSLALKAGDAGVYLELSDAYFNTNRQDEALEAARQVLKLNPDFEKADRSYALIGLILAKQSRYDEAVEILKQGAALGPNQAHFHLYLGMTYSAAGDRDSAMKEYQFLKDKNPEMASRLMDSLNKQK